MIVHVPHFYKTGAIFTLLYMPFSYMYVRVVVSKKRPGKYFFLHFVPVCIYILDYLPFFLSSGAHKLACLQEDLRHSSSFFEFSQGVLLPSSFYRVLFAMIPLYWLAQLYMLIKLSYKTHPFFRQENEYWVKWILFYLIYQVTVLLPVFLIYLSGDTAYLFKVSYIFAINSCMFIILSLFVHPGISNVKDRPSDITETKLKTPVDEKAGIYPMKPLQKLSRKQIAQMKYEIESLLQRHQPFLKHGYTLQEMATSLSYPLYQLSALINQEYGSNFNELINKYRIEYAVDIIKQGKFQNLNINGLANQCGFNNRNSFTTAFKKFTGITPSEYFKLHAS
jgi:AraC-like DNA-binding protein